jgi:hypothetical protein
LVNDTVLLKVLDYNFNSHDNSLVKFKFGYKTPDIDRSFTLLKTTDKSDFSFQYIDVSVPDDRSYNKSLFNDVETYLQIFLSV